MFGTAGNQHNIRPAVVDGHVVQLPTLAGLLAGTPAMPGKDDRHLWNALAAAVMAEDAFEAFDDEHDADSPLADVIDLASFRTARDVA